jgi:hypothetical protein
VGASVVEGRMHPSVVEGMHPSHEEASKHPCMGGSISGSEDGWERQWKVSGREDGSVSGREDVSAREDGSSVEGSVNGRLTSEL